MLCVLTVAPLLSQSALPHTERATVLPTSYTPFACTNKAARLAQTFNRDAVLSWRSRWPDTVSVAWADSAKLERTIRAEVRACLAPYTVNTTSTAQLLGLGAAYLLAADTVQAEAAFTRLITLTEEQSIADRAWYLSRVVASYIDAGLLPQALAAAARLDALGSAAAVRRLDVHNMLYNFTSQILDSLPLMVAQVQASRAAIDDLLKEVQGDAQKVAQQEARGEAVKKGWVIALMQAMDLEGRRGDYEALKRVQKAGWAELARVVPGVYFEAVDENRNVMKLGGMAPSLKSDFVYFPGQATPAPTLTRPTKGKVSLFLSFPGSSFFNTDLKYYRLAYALRRKFPPEILEITLVANTSGLDIRRLTTVSDAAAEGEQIRAFIHDYMMLPLPVAVRKAEFRNNAVNGRREPVPTEDPYRNTKLVLVDKSGIIRFIDDKNFLRLEHMIQEYSR